MDSEDPLFILYTSGSTGKPKEHYTTAGYKTAHLKNVFNYEEMMRRT
jgi:acetyl-CoA synthetase